MATLKEISKFLETRQPRCTDNFRLAATRMLTHPAQQGLSQSAKEYLQWFSEGQKGSEPTFESLEAAAEELEYVWEDIRLGSDHWGSYAVVQVIGSRANGSFYKISLG